MNPSPLSNSLITGKIQGISPQFSQSRMLQASIRVGIEGRIPYANIREFAANNREAVAKSSELESAPRG